MNKTTNSAGSGFEPELEDPESSVLPLDDPAIDNVKTTKLLDYFGYLLFKN